MGEVTRSRPDLWVRASDPSVIGAIRRTAVQLAEVTGFDEVRREQVAVAVSEAVSNLVKHAVDAVVLVRPHLEMAGAIEVVAIDRGPGMPDVPRAMLDGYSTSGTLGIGMGAIARMASGHDIYSAPGKGTVLVMHFTPGAGPAPPLRVSALSRPIGEEVVCGDAYAFADTGAAVTVMLCDGLGHGSAAAYASAEAVRIFHEDSGLSPLEILRRVHQGLGHTRGGAVAVARIAATTVEYAGLGNVAGWIVDGETRQGMISLPGIAGHRGRQPRSFDYVLPPRATVVLHSDGLTDRWNPALLPRLFTRTPAVVAATLLREAGHRRDDACVIAVRSAHAGR